MDVQSALVAILENKTDETVNEEIMQAELDKEFAAAINDAVYDDDNEPVNLADFKKRLHVLLKNALNDFVNKYKCGAVLRQNVFVHPWSEKNKGPASCDRIKNQSDIWKMVAAIYHVMAGKKTLLYFGHGVNGSPPFHYLNLEKKPYPRLLYLAFEESNFGDEIHTAKEAMEKLSFDVNGAPLGFKKLRYGPSTKGIKLTKMIKKKFSVKALTKCYKSYLMGVNGEETKSDDEMQEEKAIPAVTPRNLVECVKELRKELLDNKRLIFKLQRQVAELKQDPRKRTHSQAMDATFSPLRLPPRSPGESSPVKMSQVGSALVYDKENSVELSLQP